MQGRALENWFPGYEAFALLTGLRLMGVAGHKARGCRPAPREPTALLFDPLSANRGPNSTFIELENELADRGTRGHGVPSGAAAEAWRPQNLLTAETTLP